MKRYLEYGVVLPGLLLLTHGCASMSVKTDLKNVQCLAKKMMDRQAGPSVSKLFGTKFDPTRTRLIKAGEIQAWVAEHKVDLKKLPLPVQKAVKDERTIGLWTPEIVPMAGKAGEARAYHGAAIFLPFWGIPDFGGWWIHGGGPCNGDFCLNCTGCYGIDCTGHAADCVCTNSCEYCQDCPPCPPCPEE